jgi:acetyl esterase/lipase
MTPRSQSVRSNSNGSPKDNEGDALTVIVSPPGEPSYAKCESKGDFVNPFPDAELPAKDKNALLNLNLGQTLVTPEKSKLLLWVLRLFNSLLIEWWEVYLFDVWKHLPLGWRRKLTFVLWKAYLPAHKALLGKRTGLHPDASAEYHALTSIMYWGRFLPVSVRRMRFSLSQLHVVSSSLVQSKVRVIRDDMKDFLPTDQYAIHPQVEDFVTVKGLFLEYSDRPSEWTLFWVYGGAFLSGDCVGNSGPADAFARACQMDVFIPEYRLVPEHDARDIIWDVCLAYRWLCQRRDPSKIVLLGISSGAALCTILLQNIAKASRGEAALPDFAKPAVQGLHQPAGAILMGPFVDFTEPSGALTEYQKHDLVVNQQVLRTGIPFLDTHLPPGQRQLYSPAYTSCVGLPPLCIAVSEHEVTYDMTKLLVNQARRDGVPVTVGIWRYMCHVFSFLNAFIPEGEQSMKFCMEWIRQQQQARAAQKDL